MMYNKIVHDCFFQPQHVGTIDKTQPFVASFRTPKVNGVIIDLYAQCNPDGVVLSICFKTNGNPYLIAALEWWCRQVIQKNIKKLPSFNREELIELLEIPFNQAPLIVRVEDAYKEILKLMKKNFEG